MSTVEDKLREKIASGADQESVLSFLKDEGYSIIQSIQAVKRLYNLSLGDAKQIVSSTSCWNQAKDSHNEFHKTIFETLKSECDDQNDSTAD